MPIRFKEKNAGSGAGKITWVPCRRPDNMLFNWLGKALIAGNGVWRAALSPFPHHDRNSPR